MRASWSLRLPELSRSLAPVTTALATAMTRGALGVRSPKSGRASPSPRGHPFPVSSRGLTLKGACASPGSALQPQLLPPPEPRAGGGLTPRGAGLALAPDGDWLVPLQGPGRRGGPGGEPHHCEWYVPAACPSLPPDPPTGPSDGCLRVSAQGQAWHSVSQPPSHGMCPRPVRRASPSNVQECALCPACVTPSPTPGTSALWAGLPQSRQRCRRGPVRWSVCFLPSSRAPESGELRPSRR